MKRDRKNGTGSYKVKKRPYKVKNTLDTQRKTKSNESKGRKQK